MSKNYQNLTWDLNDSIICEVWRKNFGWPLNFSSSFIKSPSEPTKSIPRYQSCHELLPWNFLYTIHYESVADDTLSKVFHLLLDIECVYWNSSMYVIRQSVYLFHNKYNHCVGQILKISRLKHISSPKSSKSKSCVMVRDSTGKNHIKPVAHRNLISDYSKKN